MLSTSTPEMDLGVATGKVRSGRCPTASQGGGQGRSCSHSGLAVVHLIKTHKSLPFNAGADPCLCVDILWEWLTHCELRGWVCVKRGLTSSLLAGAFIFILPWAFQIM